MATKRQFVYTHRSVRKQGLRDGRDWWWKFWPPKWPFRESKESQPSGPQADHAQFEIALKEAAENDMRIVAEEWVSLDKELKPDYCAAVIGWQKAKERADKEGSEVAPAAKRFADAEQRFFELPSPALDPRWMVLWLIVIGLAELPLNYVVFQLLGQRLRETFLIAGGLALVLPLLAHVFGAALRQTEKSIIDKCLIAAAPIVAFGLLFVIALIREKFFEASAVAETLKVRLTPVQGTVLFLSINVALFFVAMVLSYEGTHPDRRLFSTRRRNLDHARRGLAKESTEAAAAAKQEESTAISLHKKRAARQKAFERAVENAQLICENADSFVGIYRAANLESRRTAEKPACFRLLPPKAALPGSLEQLDWNCDGASRDRS